VAHPHQTYRPGPPNRPASRSRSPGRGESDAARRARDSTVPSPTRRPPSPSVRARLRRRTCVPRARYASTCVIYGLINPPPGRLINQAQQAAAACDTSFLVDRRRRLTNPGILLIGSAPAFG
jgi:hypothetical protein